MNLQRRRVLTALAALAGSTALPALPALSAPAAAVPRWPGIRGGIVSESEAFSGAPMRGQRVSLLQPVALAASPQVLYVADAGWGRILRIDRVRNSLGFIAAPRVNVFTRLVLGPDGTLFVLEPGRKRIHALFAPPGMRRSYAEGDSYLTHPVDIAWDERQHHLVVADGLMQRLVTYRSTGFSQQLALRLSGDAALQELTAVACGPDGYAILDRPQRRVWVFSREGGMLHAFGEDVLQNPHALVIDWRGRTYVMDGGAGAVFVFDSRGKNLRRLNPPGGALGGWRIGGLAQDAQWLYISDAQGGRIDVVPL